MINLWESVQMFWRKVVLSENCSACVFAGSCSVGIYVKKVFCDRISREVIIRFSCLVINCHQFSSFKFIFQFSRIMVIFVDSYKDIHTIRRM